MFNDSVDRFMSGLLLTLLYVAFDKIVNVLMKIVTYRRIQTRYELLSVAAASCVSLSFLDDISYNSDIYASVI